jgi:hypothetical protein
MRVLDDATQAKIRTVEQLLARRRAEIETRADRSLSNAAPTLRLIVGDPRNTGGVANTFG